MLNTYIIAIILMSMIALLAFGIDKVLSKNENRKRLPESALLSLVSFGGAPGGLVGLYIFRHKSSFTRKFHFAIGVWFSVTIQVALGIFIALFEYGKLTF
ncbi:MAG: DUF1294 domain-containing protein [Ruminococcaceae bacterium]|nr:DUF1294 domain-containing protein [Oscillospiraceae bacterium]